VITEKEESTGLYLTGGYAYAGITGVTHFRPGMAHERIYVRFVGISALCQSVIQSIIRDLSGKRRGV